ncbi:MAG: diacylglycerol kinase family protein [Cyclobacteriaceae bacterium]|nr:diacylglycerol kinase family protein [Cyclobacteriaceae bacterium]
MKKFIESFVFAAKGIRLAVSGQRHMKFHLGSAFLVLAIGAWVDLAATDWALVLLAIGMVISAELLNSAVEGLVDLVEPQFHPAAGKVKDIAAGGVLVAAVCALAIGIIVFIKYLPS